MTDDYVGAGKSRSLSGFARGLERVLLITMILLGAAWAAELHFLVNFTFFKEQYLGLFLALGLGAVFLGVKARRREPGDQVPWHDWLLCLAGLVVGGYIVVFYPAIAYRLGVLTLDKWLLGAIAVLLILEATRRLIGWAIIWVAVVFILYANLAYLLPGLLFAKGSSWERIAAARATSPYGRLRNSAMRKAATPITGGISCPPVEATASMAAAR